RPPVHGKGFVGRRSAFPRRENPSSTDCVIDSLRSHRVLARGLQPPMRNACSTRGGVMAKRLVPIAVLVLFACATAPKVEQLSLEDAEYVLGAEDVIEVSILQSPDLSRTLPVRPDGRISLPLVGEVMAS